MFKDLILNKIESAVTKAVQAGQLPEMEDYQKLLRCEIPKNAEYGDFAVNVSPLAKFAKKAPVQIAQIITDNMDFNDADITVIAGFINFKLTNKVLNSVVEEVLMKKDMYGSNESGKSQKIILEYISANPTGPLHIGHGRWAAMGSALANLLKFSSYDVYQEFYINDAGNQINNLAKSLWIRVLQQMGKPADFPADEELSKNYYTGDYLIETAQNYLKENSEKAEDFAKSCQDVLNPSDEIMKEMAIYAKAQMLKKQQDLLANFRVHFDNYFSELYLHQNGYVDACVKKLEDAGKLYEKDGAVWFRSSDYGDTQDRVIKKNDGTNTYLTADIAYHYDKLKRGFDKLINIWGADHHGYVARVKASIEALGDDPDKLEVLLGQLVNLVENGEQVRMGKRTRMLTLEDLIEEVGVDATRFWMIMRNIDTTLDFDIDLAKSSNDENPVYYAQYAHARSSSILRNACAPRVDVENNSTLSAFFEKEELENLEKTADLNNLWDDSDKDAVSATRELILKIENFKDVVLVASKLRAPYMICRYLLELAASFHHFYNCARVLNVEKEVMKARLSLVISTKQVLKTALGLIGVSAPETM